jgi:hypothetical protein
MTVPELLVALEESARRLQAQAGTLRRDLHRPTIDMASIVQTLIIIEDTAHAAIERVQHITE